MPADLADALLERFADRERGGFWFTAEGEDPPLAAAEELRRRRDGRRQRHRGAARSRGSAGSPGETRYLDAAEAAVRGAGYASVARAPEAHAAMLNALDEYLEPVEIVVIRGAGAELAAWQSELARAYAPRRMVVAIPAEAAGLPEALAAKRARERTVAYVCRGPVCSEPIERLDALGAQDFTALNFASPGSSLV